MLYFSSILVPRHEYLLIFQHYTAFEICGFQNYPLFLQMGGESHRGVMAKVLTVSSKLGSLESSHAITFSFRLMAMGKI